ncbi:MULTISPECIES: pyocin knob domain-containing protein [Paenibacillus]|uniref:Pyocin knob domain-containing protein n=1 Tax=Paenibacillus amylolyticus TaxID=1451 RepID=A0ABD8AWA1_PAEAM|nr:MULTISPECIES: pyocin knob domain-containing protein [Paenibacillus]ETT50441.1 Phage protein [Paenibacillus sp. FSL H7-689]OME97470.1 hypothetical protein BK124_15845 [Paenibacillus amylolyticus]OMF44413.1 hypothetical protein BK136_11145 [Paenibacillus amylolyticus]
MPQETDRLKLPLPLGNENVTRESINGIFEKIDAGVATQADLDTLREAVSQMDIPDASLTQKGKVQLSNKTDGSSETVAATEKAVRDALTAAKAASLLRTGGAMTGRLIMNQWGTFSGSSNGSVLYGSNCFLDGNTFKYENNHSNLGARGIYMRYSGAVATEVYMFDTGPVATTAGAVFTPNLARIVHMGDLFQKHKLTADDGKNQSLAAGTDLNSVVVNGQYNGYNLVNSPLPTNADGWWWYVEVQCHTNGNGYVLQRASRLNGGVQTLYQRTRENNTWSPWSPDLFQAVADAKNRHIISSVAPSGGNDGDIWYQYS